MKKKNFDFFSFQTFIFDFDGTLVDSNKIKHNGFFECAKKYKNGLDLMSKVKANLKKKDRFTIFKNFSEKISESNENKLSIYKNLLEEYKKYTVKEILNLDPIKGSIPLLKKLKTRKKSIYINSATPLDSLSLVIDGRGLNIFIDGIYGMECSKIMNLIKIKEQSSSDKNSMIMIGDGKDDKEAALNFGIEFLPVGELLTMSKPNYSNLI